MTFQPNVLDVWGFRRRPRKDITGVETPAPALCLDLKNEGG